MKKNIIFESDINNTFTLLNENTFDYAWESIKNKLTDSIKKIESQEEAISFIKILWEKIKNFPPFIKNQTLRYVILTLIGIFGFGAIINSMPSDIKASATSIVKKEISYSKTKTSTPQRTTNKLMQFLKMEEGAIKEKGKPVLKAYALGDGKITVGWGHAEDKENSHFKLGEIISLKTAENLFKQDVKNAEDGLNRLLKEWKDKKIKVQINQDMYDAMVSMIFNMGVQSFRNSEFIQLVKKNKLKSAQEKILTTNVTYPGHEKRRQKEAEMFKNGILKLNATKIIREFIRKKISKILSA